MAAKKKTSGKKVTIEIDVETLQKLADAADALAEAAANVIMIADDPAMQARAKKRLGKKRAKKK